MKRFLAALAVAGALASSASAAPPTTKTPGVLTVGLAMPAAGFQVGAVRGRNVVLAKASRSTSRESWPGAWESSEFASSTSDSSRPY